MKEILSIIIDVGVYLILGGILSWLFYSWKRKDLLGGFIGGLVVGIFGSILGALLLHRPLKYSIDFLQKGLGSNVDILAAIFGGYIALYIFNKINHDKQRQDY
ncbi:MAG: hypothetical protein OEZ13_03570 [Spirochaetia bacterium]|nr:hypothetical protein [Spirochaetia bacterium]